eukprot:7873623-Heterocapsa_arctica.AAC.1
MGLGIEVAELRDTVPELTKRTGIVAIHPELALAKHKAEHAAEWKNEEALFTGEVFTDGSAIHPELPWLRRASWAIAWRGPDGHWRFVNGRTPGIQTVARSE